MNIKHLILFGFLMAIAAPAQAIDVQWIYSTAQTPWHEDSNIQVTSFQQDQVYDAIITRYKEQKMLGFGGCFGELGWDALCQLDEKQRQEVIYRLFSPQESNYTYCRMPIGASDFAMNFYSLNDVADDFEMINFSVDRDRHILMRYIKSAQAFQPALKMWASP